MDRIARGLNNIFVYIYDIIVVSGIDYDEIAREQLKDESTKAIRADPSIGLRLVEVPQGDLTLLCAESTGKRRPFVPVACLHRVYEVVHGLAHPSVKATKKFVTDKFV